MKKEIIIIPTTSPDTKQIQEYEELLTQIHKKIAEAMTLPKYVVEQLDRKQQSMKEMIVGNEIIFIGNKTINLDTYRNRLTLSLLMVEEMAQK
jgi:antitoxin component of MazEF toxin-antitoxin module